MSTPRAELEQLLGLITSATHDAMSIYEKSGHGIPSLNSTAPHPFDAEPTTLALKKNLRILEGACDQLCAILSPPGHTLMSYSQAHYVPTTMCVVVKAGVPNALLDKPEGLSVTELSKKCGVHSFKLRKVLRALATRHCFRQVGPDSFANNRLSTIMANSHIGNAVLLCAASLLDGSIDLPDALLDPVFGPSLEPTKSAYEYHYRDKNIKGGYYGYIGQFPELQKIFDEGMLGWTKSTDDASLINDFPWKDLPSGTTFCDIGGGIGAVSIRIAKAHPHIKITIQDLPIVCQGAREFFTKECPQAIQEQRADFVVIDYLKESPVKEQDIYYLRHIMHDWPEADCVNILTYTRQVMKPDSRLFIHEYILQSLYKDKSTVNAAPEPLLPNYGAGNMRPYNQDVNLLAIANAGERTLEQFIELGAKAGLGFVKLWEFAEDGMVELKPI